MLKTLYVSELKKVFNIKLILIFGAILIVLLTIMTAVFNINYKDILETDGEDWSNIDEYFYEKIIVNEATKDVLIAQLEVALEEAKQYAKTNNYEYVTGTDIVYMAKARLAAAKYIAERPELMDKAIYIYSESGTSISVLNADSASYMTVMFSMIASVFVFFGVIVGAGSLPSEIKRGTLKTILLSPIKRHNLTTAKLLATLTVTTLFYIAFGLVVLVLGFTVFKPSGNMFLYIFNASSVSYAGGGLGTFFGFFFGLISVLSYTVFGFASGTLTRKTLFGIVIPIGSNLISGFIGLTGLGIAWFSNVFNFNQFIGTTTPFGGSNFFISLALFVVYIGGLIAASYVTFNKRDIA